MSFNHLSACGGEDGPCWRHVDGKSSACRETLVSLSYPRALVSGRWRRHNQPVVQCHECDPVPRVVRDDLGFQSRRRRMCMHCQPLKQLAIVMMVFLDRCTSN